MTATGLTRYLSGVLVPVSALRSDRSVGVGEFADLPDLAAWCASVGLDLIQILPVNDSGWQPSPYSALSAFALNPIYLRIADLPDLGALTGSQATSIRDGESRIRALHEADDRLRYGAILDAKVELLGRIHAMIAGDRSVADRAVDFAARQPWVRSYAAFKVLKARNDGAAWHLWPQLRDPTDALLDGFWSDPRNEQGLLFHAWVQQRLDEQLVAAAAGVREQSVQLKGDIPILINEDSVDVWAHRQYFTTRLRAGAPPDAENPLGQNWGFPTYNWPALETDDYRWWKDRLLHATRFYSAYRIDHVLGFFRVWSIPAEDQTGYLGHFQPSASADRERLHAFGLDDGRIRWLAEPHLPGDELRAGLGAEATRVVGTALQPIDDQDLYVFSATIGGEHDISRLDLSDEAREWLCARFRDRALVRLEHDRFVPAWCYGECSRYRRLSDEERGRFDRLAAELGRESELLWEEQARTLLGFMRRTTDMLACAEDLGAIPDCVPGTLRDLGILGLRIPRWARLWNEPDQPYIRPADYPLLSVCASSVHDTSTLREWWQTEVRQGHDLAPFWAALGLRGQPPAAWDPGVARSVVGALLGASSAICVFQLQDLLALVDGLVPDDAAAERVNVPGTMTAFNWGYRMTPTLGELAAAEPAAAEPAAAGRLAAARELAAVLRPMLAARRRAIVSPA